MNKIIKLILILLILNLCFGIITWMAKKLLFLALITTLVYYVYRAMYPRETDRAYDLREEA